MAKQHNFTWELHLVCKEHKCLFALCSCTQREWTGKHDWVLGKYTWLDTKSKTAETVEKERLEFFGTTIELDYWRDVLCRDFYYPSEVQEQPRGLSRKQKREARQESA